MVCVQLDVAVRVLSALSLTVTERVWWPAVVTVTGVVYAEAAPPSRV